MKVKVNNNFHINSIPSYFKFSTNVSSNNILPSVLNAVMYVSVFPSNSVVFRATMALSFDPGINLNEENPCLSWSSTICK